MKKLPQRLAIGTGVLVIGIILFAADVARFAGVFRGTSNRFDGACSAVALAGASADIQVDRERGVAYLSVLDRDNTEPSNGTVMLLDLNLAAPAPRAAMAYDPPDFRPQGLSLLLRPNLPARLFVVSRAADGRDAVEIAEQGAGGGFVPQESVRNAAFVQPLAIVAAGARQFYLAIRGNIDGEFPRISDLFVRSGSATLLYYDGHEAQVVERGLQYPAGLALSPDGSRLYVGEMLGKRLRVYRRDRVSGMLTLEESVPLGAAPAALDVDAHGVVWIAAHSKLLALLSHLRDPLKRAPTQVLRFDPRGAGAANHHDDPRLTQIYANDGTQLSAGSVAASWRNEFLLGAYLQHKVLICKPTR